MEKLSADALRLALVTASMEYYKKYVEGNQDFDNSEQIKEELDKLEAAGLGGTRSISKHIRDYLMDKHERKCQVCGWDKIHPITGEPPLHVHHIDGDATNNSEDNLQLLCPNCHSLTENYGRLNAKSTRPKK